MIVDSCQEILCHTNLCWRLNSRRLPPARVADQNRAFLLRFGEYLPYSLISYRVKLTVISGFVNYGHLGAVG